MKHIIRLCVGLGLVGLASVAEAKQLKVPLTGKNPGQLHKELLVAFPKWKAVVNPKTGGLEDPGLLRVESTETEIWVTVPDDTKEADVQAVIGAHVPKPPAPDPDAALQTAIQNATTLQELKDALLGKSGNGRVKGVTPD